jgi:hypothetical protein
MKESFPAAIAITLSLGLCLAILRLKRGAATEKRMMSGLLATIVHMVLSLASVVVLLVALKPLQPLAFVLSVLVFYLLSLIILVVVIVRWMRETTTLSPPAPSAGVEKNQNPLQ